MGEVPQYALYNGSWGGERLLVSEVPLYPLRPDRTPRPASFSVEEWLQCHYLEAIPRSYLSSCPPSDMPSTPSALVSPLASAQDSGFIVAISGSHVQD